MSDSSIHYALLLLPALWLSAGGVAVAWAAVHERRLRAQPPPLPIAAEHHQPEPPRPAALPSSPPLPRLEELVPDVMIPPSEPPHRGHTRIGIGPPAPGSKAPGPMMQSRTRRTV